MERRSADYHPIPPDQADKELEKAFPGRKLERIRRERQEQEDTNRQAREASGDEVDLTKELDK